MPDNNSPGAGNAGSSVSGSPDPGVSSPTPSSSVEGATPAPASLDASASGTSSSPTPSPGGVTPPPAAPQPSATPASSDLVGGGDTLDFDAIFGPSGTEEGAVIPPPQAAQPQQPPAQTPQAPAAPQQEQAPQAAAQQPPAQQVQPQAPAQSGLVLDPADPMTLARALHASEAQAVEHVSREMFALSREDAEALEADVIGTLPKLFAKAFVKTQVNLLSQLGEIVPRMLQKAEGSRKRSSQNEAKFYARWPHLEAEKHGDLVARYGAVYRQMHPQATVEQMIEHLGPMVMMAAGVNPTAPQPQKAQQASPAQPNGRAPQPTPFVPAMGGSGGQSQTPEGGEWDFLNSNVELN